jgi:hypothetical protein
MQISSRKIIVISPKLLFPEQILTLSKAQIQNRVDEDQFVVGKHNAPVFGN